MTCGRLARSTIESSQVDEDVLLAVDQDSVVLGSIFPKPNFHKADKRLPLAASKYRQILVINAARIRTMQQIQRVMLEAENQRRCFGTYTLAHWTGDCEDGFHAPWRRSSFESKGWFSVVGSGSVRKLSKASPRVHKERSLHCTMVHARQASLSRLQRMMTTMMVWLYCNMHFCSCCWLRQDSTGS